MAALSTQSPHPSPSLAYGSLTSLGEPSTSGASHSPTEASTPPSSLPSDRHTRSKCQQKPALSKPNPLRVPLKIRIPLPQLVMTTSAVQFKHARGSLLTRDPRVWPGNHSDCTMSDVDDAYDDRGGQLKLTTPAIVSPSSVSSSGRGSAFGLDSLSPFQSSASSSSSSSSSASSTSSESCHLSLSSASGPTLHSPIARDPSGSRRISPFLVSSPSPNSPAPGDSPRCIAASRPPQNRSKHAQQTPFRFRLLRSLNTGSYGAAYAARELNSGRLLCAKLCEKYRAREDDSPADADGDRPKGPNDFVRGMLAEMRAYRCISACKDTEKIWLMDLHGVVQDESKVLFVMDLMHSDLFSVISSPISKGMIRRWIAQIALGIDALHRMGVVHRDIKPENIFIVPRSSCTYVKIGDFTNAWVTEDGRPVQWYDTFSRQYIGTKEYLAPEVHRREWYGPAVDWWALGCLVWDLLVGDAIFPDDRVLDFYIKWQKGGKSPQSYLAYRANGLMDDEIDLMTGLLSIDPLLRMRLTHLESHPFFSEPSASQAGPRYNVFEEMRRVTASAVDKRLDRRSRTNEYPIDEELRDEAVCCAYADCRDETQLETDPSELKSLLWVNPDGYLSC